MALQPYRALDNYTEFYFTRRKDGTHVDSGLGAADYPLEIVPKPSLLVLVLFIDFHGDKNGNLGSKPDALEETAVTKLTEQQSALIRETTMCTRPLILQ